MAGPSGCCWIIAVALTGKLLVVSRRGTERRGQGMTTQAKENEISGDIVDAAYKVHTTLGPGFLESVYEAVLAHELMSRGHLVERQVAIGFRYDDSSSTSDFVLTWSSTISSSSSSSPSSTCCRSTRRSCSPTSGLRTSGSACC